MENGFQVAFINGAWVGVEVFDGEVIDTLTARHSSKRYARKALDRAIERWGL